MEETKDRNSNDITVLAGEFIENLRMLKYSGSSTKSYSNSLDHFNHFIKARGRNSAVEVTAHDIADYRLNLVERDSSRTACTYISGWSGSSSSICMITSMSL